MLPFGVVTVLTGVAAALVASPASAAPVVKTLATYADGAQLAARGSTVVVARRNAGGQDATLLISTGTGGAPVPAAGAGVLPVWAQPSIGTDRNGRRVVVYPRCSTTQIASCDLYSYTTSTGRERLIASVNGASTGEVDGSMERGALAFNRWRGTAVPVTADQVPAERIRLFYQAVGGTAQLVSERGGRQLALRGRWIAQVRDTGAAPRGECGRPTVELVSVGGQRRTARAAICGTMGRTPALPVFLDGDLRWGEAWNESPSRVNRYRLSDGRLQHTPLALPFRVFAHTSARAGYALTVRYLPVPPGATKVPFVYDLVSVTGL